jgi:hypothetical protein
MEYPIKDVYEYTWADIYYYYTGNGTQTYKMPSPYQCYDVGYPLSPTKKPICFNQIMKAYGVDSHSVDQFFQDYEKYTTILLYQYVLPKIWKRTAVRTEAEIDFTFTAASPSLLEISQNKQNDNEELTDLISRVGSYLISSIKYYSTIIDAYQSKITELLADVKTSDVQKFNEMPQTATVDTDDHLTSITQNDSSSNAGTPIERLKEIRDDLDNTYQRWADEFIQKFAIL